MNNIQPRKALNKAWLKVKPVRSEIENFKSNLIRLINSIDNAKDEEFHKTEVRDFLKNTWYKDKYYFNVKQDIDWAIFNGPKARCRFLMKL
jgi:adenine-specific DNA-methyltransferase